MKKLFEIADLKNKYYKLWKYRNYSEPPTSEDEFDIMVVDDFLDFIEDDWNEENNLPPVKKQNEIT